MKKILAIIPARGGSKKLPGKNIKMMAGKPLIAYTIISALESKYIDKTIVSTDSQKIIEVSKRYGAEVIQRPEYISADNSKTIGAVLHVLEVLEKKKYIPDIVILLQPTSPLRTMNDIDKAIESFLKNKDNCELVMGVCEIKPSAYWALKMEGAHLKSLFGLNFLAERNQDLPKIYIPNGSIYVITPGIIKKYQAIHAPKIIPYFMSKEKSIDIDDEAEFLTAEKLLNKYGKNEK